MPSPGQGVGREIDEEAGAGMINDCMGPAWESPEMCWALLREVPSQQRTEERRTEHAHC